MALQYSVAVRNAQLDATETATGTGPVLEIRTGAPPATAATADSGALLASITLPSDWLAAASGGTKGLAGTWSSAVTASGTAGHFRIKQAATTHIQGTVSQAEASGGTGDMKLARETAALVAGDALNIDSFVLTAGGA